MKQWFKPSSYSIPVMLAILLHGGVAGLFLLQWPAAERIIKPPVPKHIIANVVATENRAVQQRQQQAQQQHAQQQKQQAADALKKKQAAEKARKQREADALALKKKQQAEAQQKKQQAQQQAEAEAQAAADAKAKAEAEEEAAAAEREQQLREEEQQLLEQLATEQATQEMQQQQENERRAKVEAELEADFVSQVREKVERSWLYPPAVKPDQQVTVRINLVPTGEVISVVVIKGSGNTALDRSVEQAVLKASPLPVPKDVRVFERSFRTLTMVFRPENATW